MEQILQDLRGQYRNYFMTPFEVYTKYIVKYPGVEKQRVMMLTTVIWYHLQIIEEEFGVLQL